MVLEGKDLSTHINRLHSLQEIDLSKEPFGAISPMEFRTFLTLNEALPMLAKIGEATVRELEVFITASITEDYKKQLMVLQHLSELIHGFCAGLSTISQDEVTKGFFGDLARGAEKFLVTLSLFETMGPTLSFTDWKTLKHDAIDLKYQLAKISCFKEVEEDVRRN